VRVGRGQNPDINPTPTPFWVKSSRVAVRCPSPCHGGSWSLCARVLTRASETAGSVGVLASVYGISSRMRDLRDSGMYSCLSPSTAYLGGVSTVPPSGLSPVGVHHTRRCTPPAAGARITTPMTIARRAAIAFYCLLECLCWSEMSAAPGAAGRARAFSHFGIRSRRPRRAESARAAAGAGAGGDFTRTTILILECI